MCARAHVCVWVDVGVCVLKTNYRVCVPGAFLSVCFVLFVLSSSGLIGSLDWQNESMLL